jgi:hypothetical protein
MLRVVVILLTLAFFGCTSSEDKIRMQVAGDHAFCLKQGAPESQVYAACRQQLVLARDEENDRGARRAAAIGDAVENMKVQPYQLPAPPALGSSNRVQTNCTSTAVGNTVNTNCY